MRHRRTNRTNSAVSERTTTVPRTFARLRQARRRKHTDSLLERISGNQLINVIVGFLLTGLVGAWLTNYYTTQQRVLDEKRLDDRIRGDRLYQANQKLIDIDREKRDIERRRAEDRFQSYADAKRATDQRKWEIRRAYMDDLNKTRVLKIAAVWEKVFHYDATAAKLMKNYDGARLAQQLAALILKSQRTDINQDNFLDDPDIGPQVRALNDPYIRLELQAREVVDLVDTNRFWLGGRRYMQVLQYVAASRILAAAIRSRSAGMEDLRRRQDSLRVQFAALRDDIWNE